MEAPQSVSTIQCLPREVFVIAISFSLDPTSTSYRKQINNRRRVCRSWNYVICDTPQFWTTIKETDGENWTRMALAHSKSKPLKVIFETFGDLGGLWPLLPHIHRFRFFSLRIQRGVDNIPEDLLTTPAPALTHLRLKASVGGETVPLFNCQYGSIRYLHLDNVALPWGESFASLEHLILQEVGGSGLSVDRLLNLLRHSPRIVTAKIEYTAFEQNIPLHVSDLIVLPNLKSLIFNSVSSKSIMEIMFHLVLPACTTLELGSDADKGDYEDYLLLLQQLPDTPLGSYVFKPMVKRGLPQLQIDYTTVCLQIKGILIVPSLPGGEFRLLLGAASCRNHRILPHLAALWKLAHNDGGGVDVRLDFGPVPDYFIKQAVDAVCEHLPGTESISIRYSFLFPSLQTTSTVLARKSVPLLPLYEPVSRERNGQTIRTWRLPQLSVMRITTCSKIAPSLLELVKQRITSPDPSICPTGRLKLFIAVIATDTVALSAINALKSLSNDVEEMDLLDFDCFMDDQSYPSSPSS